MKRTIACAGIAALGAVSLQAAYAPGLSSTETAKSWSVSCGLRGFYDSNYNTAPKNGVTGRPDFKAEESFGFDVSPRFSLNFPMDATLVGLDYAYGMRYYAARDNRKEDQSHQVNARLDHQFTENYKVDVRDSFVVAQEPELIDDGTSLPLRADGSNFRNTAGIMFHGEFTRTLGAEVGYQNKIYDYEQEVEPGRTVAYSSLLDRMEHLATFNLRWRALQQTVAIVGYQYGVVDHTSKDLIGGRDNPDYRDNTSHYFYVGADENFTPTLNGAVRVGAQYVEYPNVDHYVPGGLDDNTWSPYADASLTWTYAERCTLQGGIKHQHSQTDIISLDVEATSLYATLSHAITAKLTGSLLATYQHAVFNQGTWDTLADDFFTVGANMAYQINTYLAAEAGYNFDRLDSDVMDRSFSRHRVYLGLRASY